MGKRGSSHKGGSSGDWKRGVVRAGFDGTRTRLAYVSSGNRLKVWDVSSGRLLHEFSDPAPNATEWTAMSWATDAESTPLIAVGSGTGRISVWNMATASIEHRWEAAGEVSAAASRGRSERRVAHAGRVTALAPREGAELCSVAEDGYLLRWSLAGPGQLLDRLHAEKDGLDSLCLAQNAPWAFVGGACVRQWDLAAKKKLAKWTGHTSRVVLMACADVFQQTLLVTAALQDRFLYLWSADDARSSTALASFTCDAAPLTLSLSRVFQSSSPSDEASLGEMDEEGGDAAAKSRASPSSSRSKKRRNSAATAEPRTKGLGSSPFASPEQVHVLAVSSSGKAHVWVIRRELVEQSERPQSPSCTVRLEDGAGRILYAEFAEDPWTILVAHGSWSAPQFRRISLSHADGIPRSSTPAPPSLVSEVAVALSGASNAASGGMLSLVGAPEKAASSAPSVSTVVSEVGLAHPLRSLKGQETGTERHIAEELAGLSELTLEDRVRAMKQRAEAVDPASAALASEKAEKAAGEGGLESLQNVLAQAIHSEDRSLLSFVLLEPHSAKTVEATVRAMKSDDVAPFLRILVDRVLTASRLVDGQVLTWLHSLLAVHSSALLAQPHVDESLALLFQSLHMRSALQRKYLQLAGRLDVVVHQMNERKRNPSVVVNYTPAVVLDEDEDAPSDSDDDSVGSLEDLDLEHDDLIFLEREDDDAADDVDDLDSNSFDGEDSSLDLNSEDEELD